MVCLFGCSPALTPVDNTQSAHQFPFLIDGQTDASEIEFRFGEEIASFEAGRIVVYGYCETRYCAKPMQIVVVYDESRVMIRHGVVLSD
jgi:hypothetical protein